MTVDLEELQKQRAAELLAERSASQEVITAFLVVQTTDGQWVAYHDFADKDLSMHRAATMDDIVGGCANVTMGCQVQQTAMSSMIMMEQRAMQMRQQQEASKVASLIDPTKLRV
jgi:glycerophosphoryl diester phosphodiesterase